MSHAQTLLSYKLWSLRQPFAVHSVNTAKKQMLYNIATSSAKEDAYTKSA